MNKESMQAVIDGNRAVLNRMRLAFEKVTLERDRLQTALDVLEISYKAMQCDYYVLLCDMEACDTCGWNGGKICTNPVQIDEPMRWKPREAAKETSDE